MSLLEKTKELFDSPINVNQPEIELEKILNCSIELLSLDDNDFSWSSWESKDSAIKEIKELINEMQNNKIPDRLSVSILFAPTGPIQEVSLSSGWSNAFLKLTERYDIIEKKIWK